MTIGGPGGWQRVGATEVQILSARILPRPPRAAFLNYLPQALVDQPALEVQYRMRNPGTVPVDPMGRSEHRDFGPLGPAIPTLTYAAGTQLPPDPLDPGATVTVITYCTLRDAGSEVPLTYTDPLTGLTAQWTVVLPKDWRKKHGK